MAIILDGDKGADGVDGPQGPKPPTPISMPAGPGASWFDNAGDGPDGTRGTNSTSAGNVGGKGNNGNGLLLIVTNLQTVHVQGRGGAGGTGGAGRTPGGDGGNAGDGGTATGTGHGGNGGRGGNGGFGARGGNGGAGGNGSNIQIVYRQQQVGVQVTSISPRVREAPVGKAHPEVLAGRVAWEAWVVSIPSARTAPMAIREPTGLDCGTTAQPARRANQEQRRLPTNHDRSGRVVR